MAVPDLPLGLDRAECRQYNELAVRGLRVHLQLQVQLQLLVALAVGCGGDDPMTDGEMGGMGDMGVPDVDYEGMVQPIFNANCLCHMEGAQSMTMEAPYLTLNPGRSYDQLVGTPAEQLPSMNRVEPGEPENSYLWHKLSGTAGSVGGSMATQMPQVGELTADELTLIEDWILGGAPS